MEATNKDVQLQQIPPEEAKKHLEEETREFQDLTKKNKKVRKEMEKQMTDNKVNSKK